jgi:anaerobic ribonucleoside-triphosphate reductase activating protein
MNLHMRVAEIIPQSLVDGPGSRTVLFLQGCSIGCPGCQSKHLWPFDGGVLLPVAEVAGRLLTTGLAVTISGGEPFAQSEALAELCRLLKAAGRHIIVYTGLAYEDLLEILAALPGAEEVLNSADVLMDGPFDRSLSGLPPPFRGSANQRAIDLKASRAKGEVVELDWGDAVISVGNAGQLLLPVELARTMADLGPSRPAPRCGQVKRGRRGI